MDTITENRDEGQQAQDLPLQDAELVVMPRCTRCNLSYLPAKSTSDLKLTYCSFLCELGDLGFSMSGLEHMERKKPSEDEQARLAPARAE